MLYVPILNLLPISGHQRWGEEDASGSGCPAGPALGPLGYVSETSARTANVGVRSLLAFGASAWVVRAHISRAPL